MIPLTDRPDAAILFRDGDWVARPTAFVADVLAAADAIPDASYLINTCQHRYWFAVTLAAAMLRGQVSLLIGDHSPAAMQALADRFVQVASVSDASTKAAVASPLRHHTISPRHAAWQGEAIPAIPSDQPAAVVFTSGSTGVPQGTAKSWGELVARSRGAGVQFGLTEEIAPSVIGTVPPHHMYGCETTVLLPLHAAVSSWCGPVFYPADIRAALDRLQGPRILVSTPLQLRAMLMVERPERPPETVISATAPLDRATAEDVERRWGCEVLEIFGATEVGSIASRRTTTDEAWSLYPGVVLSGTGEAPFVAAAHAEPRRLNDVVEFLDGAHRFRLVGRSSDMIKLGGRRASLAGLTRILTRIDGVEDGAFIAPDDLDSRPTSRLLAFVVAPTLSDADVLASLRATIDPVFLPRRLVRLDALPRTAMGKLPREALLALLPAAGQDPA